MVDRDLQIRGEGGSGGKPSSRPWDKGGGGGGLEKKMFSAFGPQFGLKIRGDPPLDPPSTYASTLIPFKPQYLHTNSPN